MEARGIPVLGNANVYGFLGFKMSCFLGFKVSWFLDFKVSWFLGFKVSKIQKHFMFVGKY